MPDDAPQASLAPELTRQLTDFARACKAAARAVILYPDGHPAAAAALGRLVEIAARATARGPLVVSVLPDQLAVGGRVPARPDPALGELASLLHEHLVGELRVMAPADPAAWREFLLLLGRPTEDLLAGGGIGRLWSTSGARHLEIREIDYAEVLRDRRGGSAAAWETIVAHCLAGDAVGLDEAATRALLEIAGDQKRLLELVQRIDRDSGERGVRAQAQALLRLVSELTRAVTALEPERVELLLRNAASTAAHLSPEVMLELLAERQRTPDRSPDVVGEIVDRMSDATVASFIANSVMAERGATARLAEAFQTLVPEPDRRTGIVSLASEALARSPLGREATFEELWERASAMLLSYRDEPFVSAEYARELTTARNAAMDVERVGDDPPDRIAGWLATVTDAEIRRYDLQLLLDLLRVEEAPDRWHEIADTIVAHVEDLVLIGDLESAAPLVRALAAETAGVASVRQPIARRGMERLVAGPLLANLASHLRSVDDEAFGHALALCHALGAAVIRPLAEALIVEERGRGFRRLTELLVSFGPAGRNAVEPLKTSPNPAVRRTAIHLLREFGGSEALPDLAPLIDDGEPNVQREAVRAIVTIGTDEAYDLLAAALAGGSLRSRDVILGELGGMRDERAIPLFRFLLQRRAYRRTLRSVYDASIDGLAVLGGTEAVAALTAVLHDGEWWAPLRTAAIRDRAAGALARIGSPEARQSLEGAAASRSPGVRKAARRHLAVAAPLASRERR